MSSWPCSVLMTASRFLIEARCVSRVWPCVRSCGAGRETYPQCDSDAVCGLCEPFVGETTFHHGRDAPLGRMPTLLGGASIASGYTPPALAGALPRHPPAP